MDTGKEYYPYTTKKRSAVEGQFFNTVGKNEDTGRLMGEWLQMYAELPVCFRR